MVLQSFSFVAFISDEKKSVWQKKDNGKLFSHFDLFLKVAYQKQIWLNPPFYYDYYWLMYTPTS